MGFGHGLFAAGRWEGGASTRNLPLYNKIEVNWSKHSGGWTVGVFTGL
jgi:hypothetical protein